MIKLYAGTSDRGTYDHVGIDGGGIFKEIVTESKLHRPPGAARAWVERLDSAQRETFQVTFGLKADTEAEALNLLTALRYKLNYVTKLEHVETGLTRNLPGNRANVAHYDPVPRHSKFKGVWYSNFVLRLAEGNWQGYTGYYDPVPDPETPDPEPTAPEVTTSLNTNLARNHYDSPNTTSTYNRTFSCNAGDLLTFFFWGNGTVVPPTGFTEVFTQSVGGYFGGLWVKTADGTETVVTGSSGGATHYQYIVQIYRSAEGENLYLNGYEKGVTSTSPTTATAPAKNADIGDIQTLLFFKAGTGSVASDSGNDFDYGNPVSGFTNIGYFEDEADNTLPFTFSAGTVFWLIINISSDAGTVTPPTPDPGTLNRIPALGTFYSRSGEGSAKVDYNKFDKPYTARNRDFDSAHPSKFLHPSTGAMNKPTSGSSPDYFFCEFEIFEITDRDAMTIVSRGSSGFGNSTYDRHIQWSFIHESHYYGVRNGDLLKATSLGLPVVICSRARVLSELGLTPYDSQAVRWGGPSEGLIVSDNTALGKEIAAGYVRTGLKTVVFFAYNVTDNQILATTQEITFTTEAELYFDFISMSIQGGYLYVKPRKQGSSLSVDYWVFPITLSGVGSRVLVDLDVGHFSAGLMLDSGSYTDAMFTFFDEVFKLVDPSDGSNLLTKGVEGKWNRHIGYVYGTHGFTTYDDNGFAAFEFSDGTGGYGLGDGWTDREAYVQMSVRTNGDVFVLGQQGGIPEVRYFKNE